MCQGHLNHHGQGKRHQLLLILSVFDGVVVAAAMHFEDLHFGVIRCDVCAFYE